jgi:hypothetical protein
MTMDRVDILVTGLDPARPRAEVIAALAAHLARNPDEIGLLLEVAPAPLVRAVSAEEAERLLRELRAIGVLVKQRSEARESAPVAPTEPDIVPIPSRKREETEDDAKTEETVPPTASHSRPPPPMEDPATKPKPIVVHDASEWFGGGARGPLDIGGPPAPPLDPRPSSSPAKFGRASTLARAGANAPRVFFAALPRAIGLAFDGTMGRAHAMATLLGAVALGLAATGLHLELELGPLLLALAVTAAIGFAGLVLQITSACVSAAAMGDRAPSALPGRLMDDYLRPGSGVFAVLAAIAWLASEAMDELALLRATRLTYSLFLAVVAIYVALGMALSAANGSALGFVDLGGARRLFSAPTRGLAVAGLGGIALGGSVIALGRLATIAATASSTSSFTLCVLVLGPIACCAVSLGAAVTGAVMGQAAYASR